MASQIAQDPTQTPTILAKHLPQASNFYLAYILFQGTASAAKNILNYSDLLEYLIYDSFFDKTPRDKYNRFTSMQNVSWGSVYPKFTNLAVIGESRTFSHTSSMDHEAACLFQVAAVSFLCDSLTCSSYCVLLHRSTNPWLRSRRPLSILPELSLQPALCHGDQNR